MKNVGLHQVESKMDPVRDFNHSAHTGEILDTRGLWVWSSWGTLSAHIGRTPRNYQPQGCLLQKGTTRGPALPEVAKLSPWLIISKAILEDRAGTQKGLPP